MKCDAGFCDQTSFFRPFLRLLFFGSLGVLILRKLRLKSGRYRLVEGRVVDIDDPFVKSNMLTQKGYSVEIEYYVNGENYSLFIGNYHNHYTYITPLKSYRLGERVELIFDTKNPNVAFRKRSPYLYIFMVISSVMLVLSIITIIV